MKVAVTILVSCVAALLALGMVMLYSSSMAQVGARYLMMQLVWCVLGLMACVTTTMVDYRQLKKVWWVLFGAAIVLLALVLNKHFGVVHGHARRWFGFGHVQFQPSEFAKLAFVLAAAHFLSRPVDELRRPANFWKGIGLLLLPFALILKEPDLGSALVLLPTGLVMMLVAGTPRRYLVKLIVGVGLLASVFVADLLFAPDGWRIPMEQYQRNRLLIYFGRDYTHFAPPHATPAELQRLRQRQLDDAYNVRQALISVGSGGLIGKGWRQGTQNALGYLPRAVAHNDFIFSVIAEEEGFVGSVIVLALYGVVLFTGLRIAGSARDRLGKLVAVGVVTLIFSHVFINIGMNIRIMPVTGVPLPLLSYGGSSVLCSLIAVGLMQNIHIHRRGY